MCSHRLYTVWQKMEQYFIAEWDEKWKHAIIYIPDERKKCGGVTRQKRGLCRELHDLQGLIDQNIVYPEYSYNYAFVGITKKNKFGTIAVGGNTYFLYTECFDGLSSDIVLKYLAKSLNQQKFYYCTSYFIENFNNCLCLMQWGTEQWFAETWTEITYKSHIWNKTAFIENNVQYVLLQMIYECLQEILPQNPTSALCCFWSKNELHYNTYAIGELVFADSFLMKGIINY